MTTWVYPPLAARDHRGARTHRRWTPVGMLTVYIVLLFAIPSNITITGMGTIGRPSVLWGLLLLLWWGVGRLQARVEDVPLPRQPVRWALALFVLIVLVGSAAALLRGQPSDQVSVGITALVRLASWCGIALVAMDGIRTHNDATRLVKLLSVAVGLTAVLGLGQVVTGTSLLDWLTSVPGLSYDWGGIDTRGSFIRASGTSTHPLEFIASTTAILPVAIALAVSGGFRAPPRNRIAWWSIVAVIMLISLISISRSAIIGLVLACVLIAPALPRVYRWGGIVVGLMAVSAVVIISPGVWAATTSLFFDASEDPSAQSRTGGLERLPDFMSTSPIIGQGWGMFTSRYYVFDNQWAGLLVEVGVLGALTMFVLIACAAGSALFAVRSSPFADTRLMGASINAAVIVLGVLFIFFDGFSFPIAGGLLFLLVGMAAALRGIAVSDASLSRSL